MVKIFIQLIIIITTFFVAWWGLKQVEWMTLFHIEEVSQSTDEKLGKLYWDIYKRIQDEETEEEIITPIDSLLTRICKRNDIERKKIKLHLINEDDINAFAFPDHHLVLFTGLIEDCENEAELCGVIAHELAHMERGHIMKKLIKEVGLSMLISMTTGKGNPEIIQEAVRVLSSTAYDRNLERDADITGVDYMIRAGIDPEAFAHFLYRMSGDEKDFPNQIFWITTHPGSEERTKLIIDYISGKELVKEPVLDSVQWEALQSLLKRE